MPDFHVHIVSPTRVEYDGDINSLVAPGEAGYLGILANHAPLLTTLREGDLTMRGSGGTRVFKILKGGFLEVQKNHVLVLASGIEEIPA